MYEFFQGFWHRWLERVGHPEDRIERKARMGLLQSGVSVGVNGAIFLTKLVLGLVLGSLALVADSIDSLFDTVGSLIVLVGFLWFRRPRDRRHPFGHGRIDLVAGLILAVLLIQVGLELGRRAILRIMYPPDYVAPWWMIGLVAGCIPIKELLARFSRHVAQETDSSALDASYWYLRFDALTTASVALGLLLSRYGRTHVDGWIALGIAGVITWTGLRLLLERISSLLGEAPPKHDLRAIETAALGVGNVRGVHDIILHTYGDAKLVSMHVEVSADLSALEAHHLAEDVERAVERATGYKTVVHVDPVDTAHPAYARIQSRINELVARNPNLLSYHDLRVSGETGNLHVSLDLVVSMDIPEAEHATIREKVSRELKENIPEIRSADVTVEGCYAGRGASSQS